MISSNSETLPGCKLCGSPDVNFGQLCDVCKGIKQPDPTDLQQVFREMDQVEVAPDKGGDPADIETTNKLACHECGRPFSPFKIGPFYQKSKCYRCYMVMKYGPQWEQKHGDSPDAPGRTKNPVKPKPTTNPKPERETVSFNPVPGQSLFVQITFEGPDEEMYRQLRAIATRERRSMEQQILFYLDQHLSENE